MRADSYKVLMVPEWYPWPDKPMLGSWGVEKARAVGRRHEVVVLAADPGRDPGRGLWRITDEVEERIRTVRVRYRRLPMSQLTFLVRAAAMLAALRRLRATGFVPDVVHASVFSAGFPALLLANRARAPLVVSEHYTGLPRGTLSRWDRAIARFTYRRAQVVCPDSDDLGDHIRALGMPVRLRQVPNVVDTSEFAPAGSRAPAGPPRALTIASLDDKKGHSYLLEALARLDRELVLDLAGDGPLRGALEDQARRLGLDGAVRFHGGVPKARVAELLRQADFLVLPSLWENAPHALLEAMASGLPVVATRVGGVPEIVDEGTGVLVAPGDATALADGIAAMCDGYEAYDASVLARRAEERYGYEAVGRDWTEVYDLARASTRRARAR
jgi:glycosyltransferase involved in cell wall biosynthesis